MTNGFGDRHATITPILFRDLDVLTSISKTLRLNLKWWGRRDSNSYTLRRWNLNPVRLPISPRPHLGHLFKINVAEDQGLEP